MFKKIQEKYNSDLIMGVLALFLVAPAVVKFFKSWKNEQVKRLEEE